MRTRLVRLHARPNAFLRFTTGSSRIQAVNYQFRACHSAKSKRRKLGGHSIDSDDGGRRLLQVDRQLSNSHEPKPTTRSEEKEHNTELHRRMKTRSKDVSELNNTTFRSTHVDTSREPESAVRVNLVNSIPIRKTSGTQNLPFIDESDTGISTSIEGEQVMHDKDAWGRGPEIWMNLLQDEGRTKGNEGIEQVWTLMKEAYVDLPVEGAQARQCWKLLVNHPKLRDEVVTYALDLRRRTGRTSEYLYILSMRYALYNSAPGEILALHRRLLEGYIVPRNALLVLSVAASATRSNLEMEAFRQIYEDLYKQCHPIYDRLIPSLLRAGKHRQALRWHSILDKRNDYPSAEASKTSTVQAFLQFRQSVSQKRGMKHRRERHCQLRQVTAADGSVVSNRAQIDPPVVVQQSLDHGVEAFASTWHTFAKLAASQGVEQQSFNPALKALTSQQSLSTSESAANKTSESNGTAQVSVTKRHSFDLDGPSRGLKRKEEKASDAPARVGYRRNLLAAVYTEISSSGHDRFSDEFCARLYATRGLTLSWVTSFLHAFTVKKIGPLALREMALRCESTEELQYHLKQLDSYGISTGRSMFCLAVKKFACEAQTDLLRGILYSDEHPDSLDDAAVQRSLLDAAVERNDVTTTHRILTILSMTSTFVKERYMNLLLRSHMRLRRVADVLKIAEEMHANNIKLRRGSVEVAARFLLRPRRPGHHPIVFDSRFRFNDLTLVTNIALRAIKDGVVLPDWLWVELFTRHGMKNLASVESFCHAHLDAYQHLKNQIKSCKQGSDVFQLPQVPQWPLRSHDHVVLASLPLGSSANPLHYIFTPKRLQYIIEWGFHDGLNRLTVFRDQALRPSSAAKRHKLSRFRRWPVGMMPPPPSKTFLRGLKVVQDLQGRGVAVPIDAIEHIIKERLWGLFGPGRSMRRRNVTAMALNPYTLLRMLRAVDKMWKGPPLFPRVRHVLQLRTGKMYHQYDADGKQMATERQISEEELLKLHTSALVMLFQDMRTAGHENRHEQRRSFNDQKWDELMHKWARLKLSTPRTRR